MSQAPTTSPGAFPTYYRLASFLNILPPPLSEFIMMGLIGVDQAILKVLAWSIGSLIVGYALKCLLSPSRRRFIYKKFAPIWTHNCFPRLSAPRKSKVVFISDPRALQEILVKENGTVFTHAPGHLEVNNLIFGPGLFGISGATHKLQRSALNPVFTTFHTKSKTSKMETVAHELTDAIVSAMDDADTREINMLDWCKVTTLETIGYAGFGYAFGAIRGSQSPYIEAMRNFIPIVAPLFGFKWYISWMYLVPRELWKKLIQWAPSSYLQRLKKMIDIQTKYSTDILESRKTMVSDSTEGECDDILAALIRANARARKEEMLPDDQIKGQINAFVFAGFETTSSSLARTIHTLAEHPHIQSQLRAELLGTDPELHDVDKLLYLDAVVRESLRLHPPVPTIERYASKDWVLPLRYATEDRKQETYVKRGTKLLVSLGRANRCKETWGEDADEFRPERWLAPLPRSVSKSKIPGMYSSMMTFSAGPRSCIGYKFAVLELKIILARLVKTFQFAPGRQPVEWRAFGCMSPHVANKHEDGTIVLDEVPTLPVMVSIVQ
ncbi:unnamed protein product [Rhizoctonia solani]|uniref:Uncharacterized protein n=1 Tax=Rhizoctonia solani TaxID=456999 RepID=A0A8H3AYY7_9AGAM|nr:unnamed protein product [Rhizoctonia solani]